METDALSILILVFVGAVALLGLWTVLGYTFEDGPVPQIWPGKAFLYPETMGMTTEIEPAMEIKASAQAKNQSLKT